MLFLRLGLDQNSLRMHKFRSGKTLFRLRLGSLLFILSFVCLALMVPALIWEILLHSGQNLQHTIGALASTVGCGLGYLMVGWSVRCPLCHGPLIGKTGCSRSSKAPKMFGSYRLAVAIRVILLGRFRCPCCGEPCKCETRE